MSGGYQSIATIVSRAYQYYDAFFCYLFQPVVGGFSYCSSGVVHQFRGGKTFLSATPLNILHLRHINYFHAYLPIRWPRHSGDNGSSSPLICPVPDVLLASALFHVGKLAACLVCLRAPQCPASRPRLCPCPRLSS